MRLLPLCCALVASTAFAADKKPKLDLGLKIDTGGALPKGEDLEKPRERKQTTESSTAVVDLTYSVVRVAHAKSFMRGPSGATPVVSLEQVAASGKPLTTEKFTTVARIKCAQRVSASIELAVLDSRSNAIMEGGGTVYFRGEKQDEADYTMDWDPTVVRQGGDYQLMVKVAGNVVGTFPFKIVDLSTVKSDAGR